jgi:hypothetical protein
VSADEVDAFEQEILADHPEWGYTRTRAMTFYGRDGSPMTFARWIAIQEKDPESKIVVHSWFAHESAVVLVSTVWLGMDHNFHDSGAPLIFETMIFGLSEDVDEYQERYPTEDAARAGHDRALALVRDWLPGCREIDEDTARLLGEGMS